jgi:hypothetical protein
VYIDVPNPFPNIVTVVAPVVGAFVNITFDIVGATYDTSRVIVEWCRPDVTCTPSEIDTPAAVLHPIELSLVHTLASHALPPTRPL